MTTTTAPATSLYAEMTPNPEVMKFVANRMLIDIDHVEFSNIEEAKPSPLATALFNFAFIKSVFISGNFIALSKYDVIEWEDVTQELRQFILSWISSDKAILNDIPDVTESSDEGVKAPATLVQEPSNEIEQRIVDILEEYVKPAVAQDGGNIAFAGYDNKGVKVVLQGACAGCPSSTMTLQQGIKQILQRMLPTLVDDVIPVEDIAS